MKLVGPDLTGGEYMGTGVAISGSTIVVGCMSDADNGAVSGSAYIFLKDGTLIEKLLADDGASNDKFGRAVAIDGSTFVIGAFHKASNGSQSGAAYYASLP